MRKTLYLLFILSLLSACNRDEPAQLHSYTNNWILANMQYHYYWNNKIPSKPNMTLEHKAFFESLLYRYKQRDGDRFSWIEPNYLELQKSLKGVRSLDLGFDYGAWAAEEKGKVYFRILYVKKGSNAETKGLKRGDIIRVVDGEAISMDNYKTIFKNKNSLKLKVDDKGEVQINSMLNFAENPIFLSETLAPDNSTKKIAYLVYMLFSPDAGDDTKSYDLALIEKFEKFAGDGVDEFILDLRYNHGGAVSSCLLLSSLLHKNRKKGDLFAKLEPNNKLKEKVKEGEGEYKFLETYNDKELPKLTKINRLFVLTGKGTASSSEMVINGLKPYLEEIILIGDTTVGKNVGSYTLYDQTNKKNKWGLQPITFKIFNSEGNSDYSGGFVPEGDNRINEFKKPMFDFGDFNDPLLNRALKVMGIDLPGTEQSDRQKSRQKQSPSVLGEPLPLKPYREGWQEKEMDYPMYIDKEL